MKRRGLLTERFLRLLGASCLAGALVACSERTTPPPGEEPRAAGGPGTSLVIGDIDPDTPTRRIRRLQPLADYVASRLSSRGIAAGEVRIATNIDEMAAFLRDGVVDYYVDSAFPTLRVRQLAGSRLLVRRWVLDQPEYRSAVVTRRDAGIRSLSDLGGRVVAMQEPYSTSGFLLPAIELIEQGFELRELTTPAATVSAGQIGYVFTRDEENTVEMIIDGTVAAGVLSSQVLDKELPPEVRQSLGVVHWTPWITRALVSVRSDLDPALVDELRSILLSIDEETSAQLEAIGGEGAWSWKFDELSADQRRLLEALESKMALAIGG